ncbi:MULTISPECIES: hypothetical protein [Vibrio]|uniref:Uncharacterized protein n=1 Tax=Vibrio qingdaonensis TaxID=2829491 RepID=A0A9X3HZQ6_9VIBR|nr:MULTISPECIES: hypothetical protein [Vibrio]MCG9660177.1 hypothetical protein [Vibrio mediterranei]MCW8349087.1 hypothetical protein [Vibrio qingdaonensis]
MHVNCSTSHTLNESATDEELNALLELAETSLLIPSQREVIKTFVSRKSIENFLMNQQQEGELPA